MDIKLAKIDPKATCGRQYYLTGVRPVYAYKDGNRAAEPHAYAYTVVLPERKFAELDVVIEGEARMEAPDNAVEVTIAGLELVIKWSRTLGNYVAGVATGIAPAPAGKS